LNSIGAIEWDNTIGGSSSDLLFSVQQTSDGRYILGGYSSSGISGDKTEANESVGPNDYYFDYWVVKFSPDGIEFCNGIDDDCDGVIDENCEGTCIVPTNLFASNITGSSAKLNWDAVEGAEGYKVRFKVSGTNEWTVRNSTGQSRSVYSLSPNTSYTWEVKTYCTINPNFSSDWSAKQHFTTGSLKLASAGDTFFDVYPNPFNSSSIISFSLAQDSRVQIQLVDVTGRNLQTILNGNLVAGDHELPLNRVQLSAGIYFLQLKMNEEVITKKIVIE
jgi:hypothetical protein